MMDGLVSPAFHGTVNADLIGATIFIALIVLALRGWS